MPKFESIAESNQTVWNDALLENPHAAQDKRARVQKMFAAIAPSYDLNNRLHSLWMDQYWRRSAVRMADVNPGETVVDVACGTGDLSLKFAESGAGNVVGVDFTFEMLPPARAKIAKCKLQNANCKFIAGDGMRLPLADETADIVSIAFGIRNVASPVVAIQEFSRILRPGGRLIILEFSLPTNPVLRGMYNFYFRQILPRTASLVSGDKTGAYRYLPESVNTFISREKMTDLMRDVGFVDVAQKAMTCGVSVCYRGTKPTK